VIIAGQITQGYSPIVYSPSDRVSLIVIGNSDKSECTMFDT